MLLGSGLRARFQEAASLAKGGRGYSKESHDAHVLRMNSETAANISDSVSKVGKLVATEGIGIGLGFILFRITGELKKDSPVGRLRGDIVKSLDTFMTLLNTKIPVIDVQPMGWLRPLLAYYKDLLAAEGVYVPPAGEPGPTYAVYVALPLAERAEIIVLFPAIARTAIHLFAAMLGRA